MAIQAIHNYFYPRSPCGERPWLFIPPTPTSHFYPRSPCGERQFCPTLEGRKKLISIHALLAESDNTQQRNLPQHPYFYPRSPCGERPANPLPIASPTTFLSTLSLRRATRQTNIRHRFTKISIHALLAESDQLYNFHTTLFRHFYPRSPCGERLAKSYLLSVVVYFYPRSPCGERRLAHRENPLSRVFLSTLSLRRATQ